MAAVPLGKDHHPVGAGEETPLEALESSGTTALHCGVHVLLPEDRARRRKRVPGDSAAAR
jgi:hypothetical protein